MSAATSIDYASRAQENSDRFEYGYTPPSQLPVPTSHPERHHRWLNLEHNGVANVRNMTKRFRDGYVIATYEEYPELAYLAFGQEAPRGQIRFADLVLAYNSQDYVKAREAYYSRQTADAVSAAQEKVMSEEGMRGKLIVDNETKSNGKRIRQRAKFEAD